MTEEVPVAAWLAKPYWPWPLALAYSQPFEVRAAAVAAAVEILDGYPRLGGGSAEYIGVAAVDFVYGVVFGAADTFDFRQLGQLEAPLLRAIHDREIPTLGRPSVDALPEEIALSSWQGAEIDSERTCDLVKAGWREQSSDLSAVLGELKRVTWYYDAHVPRAAMQAVFGGVSKGAAETPATPAQPWTEERMKAEIAACAISNRDRAWQQVFKPTRDQHGWDNTAFRAIWSEGRDSKGTTGRPAKRA